MAHTRIIPGAVVKSRRGRREEPKSIFTTNRYRVIEDRVSYPDGERRVATSTWHENRTSAYMTTEWVDTNFATIELPNGKTVEIDTRCDSLWRDEPVHVAVHHILGRQFVDLFYDKKKAYSTYHNVQFPAADKGVSAILGITVAVALIWYGRDEWSALRIGACSAVGLYGLLYLRKIYGDQRIRLMRTMTERKLKNAVSQGQVVTKE